ncbi:VQ motif-containing protein 10-like [Phoenix dactylifera]|uniref:VQ motif-containing protein 10-like n=1 Tax=Phoenix dactylifera TaxID=42345 RepID=A0A8B8ZTL9_PHODC|nr:VQ motif-containing protein 10-like [Phoenix dactylifera]
MSVDGVQPMKVRIIVTKHVQTDARQFKTVVQSLTGKDSMVAAAAEGQAERGGDVGRKQPVRRKLVHDEELKGLSMELMPSMDELCELLRE